MFKVPNPAKPISFGEDFCFFFEHFEHGSLLNVSSCIFLFFWASYVMHSFYISYRLVSFVIPISGKMMNLYTVYLTSHIPISTQGVLY